MSESAQFDNLLGGSQELPSAIRLMKFTAARCKEIESLKQKLTSLKGGGKLIFQKLPIHMRRRVMSHNAKRLPRRLREAHMNQLKKSGLGVKQKRPPRKYRRRPQNLQAEYIRRQRKHKWLETHIWHAKRFHMIERWGYKLPQSPCDKAFRACYRASAQHCLLEDISYVGCIEINAKEEYIIEKFCELYDKNIDLSIGARMYINGNREGKLTLFSNGRAVGVINFHWMPKIEQNINRTLWIWIHASIFDNVLNLLLQVFNLNLNDVNSGNYLNKDANVYLHDLRFCLNRFRLTGPLSHAILQKSLRPVDINGKCRDWLKDYLSEENKELYLKQADYWKCLENISSTSELSPHIIIGLIAVDPRYSMPKKRTKALNNNAKLPDINLLENIPEHSSLSPIWNKNTRTTIVENKISNFDLYKAREKLLVPGSDLDTPGISIPYLLIQRPGNRDQNIGYSSGWDVIIPSGWAQPTWLTFIMWGARAGGLREADSVCFEMGKPSIFAPDTEAGEEEDDRYKELYRCRYFSLPPNKRVNYNKFSIVTPFEFKWNVLLKDWNSHRDGIEQFRILRDKRLLATIQGNLTQKRKLTSKLIIEFNTPYIIPVKLTLSQKGTPKRYSIICLPKRDDLRMLGSDKASIKEPQVADKNQVERHRLRKEHKKILQKLQRHRKRCRLTGKTYTPKRNYIEEYKKEMANLWLPNVETQIRKSCSREIIGWVTKGDFSFTVGKCVAVGYIVLGSLPELLSSQHKNKVLVRNTSSRQYRIATLEIVI